MPKTVIPDWQLAAPTCVCGAGNAGCPALGSLPQSRRSWPSAAGREREFAGPNSVHAAARRLQASAAPVVSHLRAQATIWTQVVMGLLFISVATSALRRRYHRGRAR